MTQVKIDIGKLDANGIVDLANDSISVTPTSRFATATKKIVVDEPLKTALDQHGTITLNLPPTGKDWAYQLHVGAGTQHEFKVTFDVPDSANPVNFADLVTVDPSTFTPTNTGNPLADIDQSDVDWAVEAIND